MLSWGRRYLMCPPTYFEVRYEINPWMDAATPVDADVAREQWDNLVATLRAAGADIELIEPDPALPDMVFTANAGVLQQRPDTSDLFVPAHFRFEQRKAETDVFARWFTKQGYTVETLPADVVHEGAGDALPFGDTLLTGNGSRSDKAANSQLERLTGVSVLPVELADERFYHLDTTFCPLDERRAICAGDAWAAADRDAVAALIPEPLWLTEDEALSFCANSVVVDNTVVMPATPVRVGRVLEGWGFEVVTCPVDEFLKSGGACRCLTLALDNDI